MARRTCSVRRLRRAVSRVFFKRSGHFRRYGIGKPRPEIFLHLTDRLGLLRARLSWWGNSLERDIAGARNAGITSIWLKVAGSEEHADVEPDFTITGLVELPALLERLDA